MELPYLQTLLDFYTQLGAVGKTIVWLHIVFTIFMVSVNIYIKRWESLFSDTLFALIISLNSYWALVLQTYYCIFTVVLILSWKSIWPYIWYFPKMLWLGRKRYKSLLALLPQSRKRLLPPSERIKRRFEFQIDKEKLILLLPESNYEASQIAEKDWVKCFDYESHSMLNSSDQNAPITSQKILEYGWLFLGSKQEGKTYVWLEAHIHQLHGGSLLSPQIFDYVINHRLFTSLASHKIRNADQVADIGSCRNPKLLWNGNFPVATIEHYSNRNHLIGIHAFFPLNEHILVELEFGTRSVAEKHLQTVKRFIYNQITHCQPETKSENTKNFVPNKDLWSATPIIYGWPELDVGPYISRSEFQSNLRKNASSAARWFAFEHSNIFFGWLNAQYAQWLTAFNHRCKSWAKKTTEMHKAVLTENKGKRSKDSIVEVEGV